MKAYYVTITGMNHYYDMKPFKIGKRLKCIKEPDNDYDEEAIRVVLKHIGTIGYVANSVYTRMIAELPTAFFLERCSLSGYRPKR